MCDDISKFSTKRNSKNKTKNILKNRKLNQKALSIKLLDNPIDDVEIKVSKKSKNILQKRRLKLPVSINIKNCDFLKRLLINQKCQSETDPHFGSTKLPKNLKEPVTSSIDLPELDFCVVGLTIPTIFKEKAIVTFSEEFNVAIITDKPSVVEYRTAEDSSIIDLILDNSFDNGSRVSEFNGIRGKIEKDVKEEIATNNFSKPADVLLSKTLPLILLPASATCAPISELVIPQSTTLISLNLNAVSERSLSVLKQKSLNQSDRNKKKRKIQHHQSLSETNLRRNNQNFLQKAQPNTQQRQSVLVDPQMRVQQTGSTSQLRSRNQSITHKQQLTSELANQSSQQNQNQLILLDQQNKSNVVTVSGSQKIQQNKNSVFVKFKTTGTNQFQQKEFHYNPSALLNKQQKAHSISCYQKQQQNIVSSVQTQLQQSVSTAQILPSFQNQHRNGTALLSQTTQPTVSLSQVMTQFNYFKQIVSPRSEPTPINQSQPPQLRNLRCSSGLLQFHQISNKVCTEKILPYFRIYICNVIAATKFRAEIKYCFSDEESKLERDKFREYWRSCSKMLGKKLIRRLATVNVASFDLGDLVGSLRDKLVQDQISITRLKVLKYLTTMVSDNRDQCNTPFLKKLLYVLLACTQKIVEKTVPIFSVAQLKCLENQIRHYLLINNWLCANLENQTTERPNQLNQEQSPSMNNSPSTHDQQTQQNLYSNLFVQFSKVFNKANDIQVLQSCQNVNIMMREKNNDATNTAKMNGESALSTTEIIDVKNEDTSKAKVTLGDKTIDLTWIDNCDEEQILEEIIEENKSFIFKVEDCAETGDKREAAGTQAVSPVDSGLGSSVTKRSGDDYKCLCGNRAIYVCVCNSSMYCSSDCQLKDWVNF